MIVVKDKETGEAVGTISAAQLKFLIDELEEETSIDQDYWINRPMLGIFREHGADEDLVAMIETAMGDRDDMEIVWVEE